MSRAEVVSLHSPFPFGKSTWSKSVSGSLGKNTEVLEAIAL